jgi:predicted transposase/invertase (TIGR01784 family)
MEGRKEGMLEAARRMLREDFTIEQIAKFTGLSEAQLRKAFSEK